MIFLFFNPSKIFAQSSGVNFSGSWTFKGSQRILGGAHAHHRSPSKFNIIQDGNNMSVERINNRQSGEEFKTTDKFTLDGKEWVNTETDTTRKSTTVWSADKKSLIISSSMVIRLNGASSEFKTVEVWKLADSRKSLTIDYIANPPIGQGKDIVVYIKK